MNKVVRIIIYVAWALLSLLVFIYLTFPTDVLRDVVRGQLTAQLKGTHRVDIDGLSLAGLTGIRIEGLRLLPTAALEAQPSGDDEASEPDEGGAPSQLMPTTVDEVTVTASLLSLISGDPEVDFDLRIGDGELYGSWSPHPDSPGGHVLEVSSQSLPVMRLGLLTQYVKSTLTGTLTGHVRLEYPRAGANGRPALGGGEVDLAFENAVRGPGPLPIPGLPAAPYLETPTRIGDIRLQWQIEGTEVNFEAFEGIGGPDLEFQVTGRATLRQPLAETQIFATLLLGFSQEWMDANGLGAAMRSIRLLQDGCTGSQCRFALRGSLGRMQTQPLGGGI